MSHPWSTTPPGRHAFEDDGWQPPAPPVPAAPHSWWGEAPARPVQPRLDPAWVPVSPAPPVSPALPPVSPAGPPVSAVPYQPAWQPQASAWQPPAPDPEEETWADLRNQVTDRLRRMNGSHCLHAFDAYGGSDAIGPHGIALFYAEPMPETRRVRLCTATRLFLDGEDAEHLPALLGAVTGAATANLERAAQRRRPWDPRHPDTGMVNRSERMSPRAEYVGVGVSTLDMPGSPWSSAAPAARSALDLPGRGYALLLDGTALVVERRSNRGFTEPDTWCNRSLDIRPGQQARLWSRTPRLVENADEPTRRVWERLRALHEVLLTTRTGGTGS